MKYTDFVVLTIQICIICISITLTHNIFCLVSKDKKIQWKSLKESMKFDFWNPLWHLLGNTYHTILWMCCHKAVLLVLQIIDFTYSSKYKFMQSLKSLKLLCLWIWYLAYRFTYRFCTRIIHYAPEVINGPTPRDPLI